MLIILVDMSVRKEVLSNGLTVVTEAMSHVRSVAIGVWIKSGSRCEPPNKNGICHFIEHMVFKGTKTRTAEDIAIIIDSIGGQLDAFTSREYTGFYAKVLDEHLPVALELLSDIVLNPSFPEDEMKRERNVIFEEINMVEDSPQELVHELFTERFWRGHPLGRPVSGTKRTIRSITREDLVSFFKRNYAPENMLIAAAGNLKHDRVIELVKRHFSDLEGRANHSREHPPKAWPHIIIRNKAELEQAHICLGTISPPIVSEDRFAAHVLNNILGGGLSSRLFQNIRERHGLAYAIFSGLILYKDAGCLTIYAGTANATAERVIELILEELRRIRSEPVSRDELERSKENIKGGIVLSMESTSSRMSNLAQQDIYFGRFFSLGEVLKRIDKVTIDDVMRIAHEIFDNRYLSLTLLGNLNGLKLSRSSISI